MAEANTGAFAASAVPPSISATEPLIPPSSSPTPAVATATRQRSNVPPPPPPAPLPRAGGLRHARTAAQTASSAPRGRAYRTYGVGPIRFRLPDSDDFSAFIYAVADYAVYALGPILICLAFAIILGLTYTFFVVILPMLAPDGPLTFRWIFHVSLVLFFLINVTWNYVLCVCTSNKGLHFDRVVRELAEATGFRYPETEAEVEECKREYRDKMLIRGRQRRRRIMADQQRERDGRHQNALGKDAPQAAAGTTAGAGMSATAASAGDSSKGESTTSSGGSAANDFGQEIDNTRVFGWMLMAPDEWGFCANTNQPKPPRSHYDHVTKLLVLNMDHYCPWMFNTVGYFNYRYFCNFLFYVFTGMLYGAIIAYQPFREIGSSDYFKQVQMNRSKEYKVYRHLVPNVPLPSERTPIAFSFMLCLSVGIAVMCLMSFHFYLVFTAQTTIEFHGNWSKRRQARKRGRAWMNPYDLGWKRNWQQVFGSRHPLVALLPSWREPEFLPLPILGEKGRRRSKKEKEAHFLAFRRSSETKCCDVHEINRNPDRNELAHIV